MQTQDFNSMQEKALQYAREMQQKSQATNSCNHVSETHSSKSYDNYFNSQSSAGNNKFNGINNIFSSSNHSAKSKSNDLSLILSLILMLSSEGGDKLLMLALLYIMT